MSRRLALLSLAFMALARPAHGDGGAIRLQQVAGPFAVTVFTPEPLRVGAVDFSVLVQAAADEAVILDATVALTLTPPDGSAEVRLPATREAATNKLLVAAIVDLDRPGVWKLRADVRRGEQAAEVEGEIEVGAAPPRWQSLWPYLALPLVVVALFAVGQWLAQRRG